MGVHGITPASLVRYSVVFYRPPVSLLPEIMAAPGKKVVLEPDWDTKEGRDEYWLDDDTLVLCHVSVETALAVVSTAESFHLSSMVPGAATLVLAFLALGRRVTLPEDGSNTVLEMLRGTTAGRSGVGLLRIPWMPGAYK